MPIRFRSNLTEGPALVQRCRTKIPSPNTRNVGAMTPSSITGFAAIPLLSNYGTICGYVNAIYITIPQSHNGIEHSIWLIRKHVTFNIFSDSVCGRVIAARKIHQRHVDMYRAVNGNKKKMKGREAIVFPHPNANDILRTRRRYSSCRLRLLKKDEGRFSLKEWQNKKNNFN